MHYLVVFGLGVWQGLILCDWYRDKKLLNKVGAAASPAAKKSKRA